MYLTCSIYHECNLTTKRAPVWRTCGYGSGPFSQHPKILFFIFLNNFCLFTQTKFLRNFVRSECEAPSDPSPGGPLPGEVLLVLEGKEDFSLGHSANDPKRSDEHRAVPCFQWKTQRIVPSAATTTERLRKNTPPQGTYLINNYPVLRTFTLVGEYSRSVAKSTETLLRLQRMKPPATFQFQGD